MTVYHPEGNGTLWLVGSVAMCLALLAAASASAADLRVGVAATKITPANGTPLAGYYSPRPSTGVLDDLYAKAAVLDDGKTKVALVVCDLLWLPRSVVLEARQQIQANSGISADCVMISATHTHTAPVVVGESSLDELMSGGSPLCREYAQQLPQRIAQAVAEANSHLTAARLSYGQEQETKLSFIRRYVMKDGSVRWNPGKLNPNVVRPIGQIDPQVNVIFAETPDKRPLWTYVNFANHLDTTGGTLISADFPATLARRLADYKGAEMLTMFANGTCGNINHLNVHWGEAQSSPAEARRIGTILAADVLKAYMDLKPADGTLRVRRELVALPLAPFTEEELRHSQEVVAKHDPNTPFLEQVKAYRILDVAARQGKPYEVDVQVFSLGRELAWVALPGEVFVELGLGIKAASPFAQTQVIELANGVSHYIPSRSAYPEGQYEVVTSRYAEGAGEQLMATAIRLVNDLYQEAKP